MARRDTTICLFGTFEDSQLYSRNTVVREALESVGFGVSACRPSRRRSVGWAERRAKGDSLLRTGAAMARDWLSLLRQRASVRRADIIHVPYPPHLDVFLARLLRRRAQPVVIDAFLGLHDTIVDDRRMVPQRSLRARAVRAWERAALRGADLILIDTRTQADQLAATYGISAERFVPIPVGIDENVWHFAPYPPATDDFLVAFWGTFIPLHGAEIIVRAAALLVELNPRVRFRLLGDGQTADEIDAVLRATPSPNVEWERSLRPIEDLRQLATDAACVLGVFGTSEKAGAVIPYKVYQALATGRPVVTRDAEAWASVADDEAPVVAVPPGDAEALAEALDRLERDPERCRQLAADSRIFFDHHLSARVVRERLDDAFDRLHLKP